MNIVSKEGRLVAYQSTRLTSSTLSNEPRGLITTTELLGSSVGHNPTDAVI